MFQPPWGGMRGQSASYCKMNNEAGIEGLKLVRSDFATKKSGNPH